jgi:hypothetical protein
MRVLTDIEARVLGALIEKELTTPEYYPLSLNALVNACNQKSNREPVMNLDDAAVSDALRSLDKEGLAGRADNMDSRVTNACRNSSISTAERPPCSANCFYAVRRRRVSCADVHRGCTSSKRSARCKRLCSG